MHTVEEVCSRLCFIVDLLCFICDCSTFGVLCRSKLHLFGFLSWRSLLFSRGPPQRPTSWWCCPQSDGCFALYHLRKRRVQDNHVGWAGAHFRSSDLHHRRAARCGLNKAWNHTHTPRLVGTTLVHVHVPVLRFSFCRAENVKGVVIRVLILTFGAMPQGLVRDPQATPGT